MVKAFWLFNHLKINHCAFYHKIVRLKEQFCFLSASRVIKRQNAPKLQIIVSFNKQANAQTLNKERWQIESAFKALKTSGFNIGDTHLTDIERISKLMALVLITFAWVYKIGIYLDGLHPVKIKNH